MNRVEQFKEARKFRRKCKLMFMFFLMLVLTGICVSDYSINALMKNEKRLEIFKIEEQDNSNVLVSFMNMSFKLDTSYISKDLKSIKDRLGNIFG